MMFHVGILYRVAPLLEFLHEHNTTESKFLRDFPTWIGIPSRRALELGFSGGWLAKSDTGAIVVTEQGFEVLAEPTPVERLRMQVKMLVDSARPSWANLAIRGRKAIAIYAPAEAVQCLAEAELLDGSDPDTVNWWDCLAATIRQEREAEFGSRGREGERLTVRYEKDRTGIDPEWVALDTSEAGFDVLSRVDRGSSEKLLIEVKTSRLDWSKAGAILTRNEWTVLGKASYACLHLWQLRDHVPLFAMVPISSLARHIPDERGGGSWQTVRIPFSALDEQPTEASV